MKRMIEKNVWAGLDEYFCSLTKALSVECEVSAGGNGLKRKTRRRRRVVGPGTSLQTHASDLLLPSTLSSATIEQPHVISSSMI